MLNVTSMVETDVFRGLGVTAAIFVTVTGEEDVKRCLLSRVGGRLDVLPALSVATL